LQSSVSYSYDPATLALDTETITIDPDGSGSLPALTRVLDRSTDTFGRQSGTAVSAVGSGTPEHYTNYAYDNSGRLSTVTSPAGTFTYTYTPNSSLITTVSGPAHTVTNTWEPNRDVLDVKENRIPSTTPPISSFNYGVNAIGQRTGVQTTGSAFPSQPADWTWGYDALGQVVSADSPTTGFDRAYEYDQIGNRKKSADSLTLPASDNYTANNLNQYTSVPSVPFVPSHDFDGNQIDALIHPEGAPAMEAVFVWDAENRLVTVKDKSTNAVIVSYTYDSQSRRIARTEGGNVTLYLYDGWNCLSEYTLQNSTFNLQAAYAWGLDLSGSLLGAGGVGGLLATTKFPLPVGEGQGEGVAYYATYDGNGNVSEYLTATGTIAAHYEYDPFGRTIVATGANAADFSCRFSSKSVDSATALYYYGYRYYDPVTGRWPSRDPMEESGGLNLYGFVGNAGLADLDMLGLASLQNIEDTFGPPDVLELGVGLPVLSAEPSELKDFWSEYFKEYYTTDAKSRCQKFCDSWNMDYKLVKVGEPFVRSLAIPAGSSQMRDNGQKLVKENVWWTGNLATRIRRKINWQEWQKYKVVQYDSQRYYCDCLCRKYTDLFWAAARNTNYVEYKRKGEYVTDVLIKDITFTSDAAGSMDADWTAIGKKLIEAYLKNRKL
jgi:RHS repeat-associated protein